MSIYKIHKFHRSRIATIDVCGIGMLKHHIVAMVEIDVSACREKIKRYKKEVNKISFTAWLIKTICLTIREYEFVASYLKGKGRQIVFQDINVSMVVEKEINGQKVPIPLIIEKADERSIESITEQINEARNKEFTKKDIVLQKKTNRLERLYYLLPGFLRKMFWKYLLKHPRLAFQKMGNVAFTSVGMIGSANGWFIPKSVHPVCFGINGISKKPVVVDDKIVIREILNMTILLDHDVIDGAPMARFVSKLTHNIETGYGLT